MSSFLSSLFGYSDRPAQGSKLAYIPEELKPYVTEILKDTQELYKQRMKEGYTPYTGDTIAGLTPEEIASQEGLKSLVGTQRPFQEESLGLLRGGSEQFTADTAKKYMSPYMRAVIDSEKEQAQRQYERTKRPEFEKSAVDAGGMSGLGTRAAVEAAERETGQQRLLADIETRGQQKAYQDAQQAFEDQKRRERELAGDISTTGQNIFSAGLAEQGLLKGIGEEKRELAQSGLDEAYMKYMEQKQFPEQQLARYMASIYGNPILKQPNYITSERPAQASKAKSLIGLGLSGIKGLGGGSYSKGFGNLAKGFGNLFNPSGAASGGQVGGLNTLHRQTGGTLEIMDEDVEFQTGADRQPEEIIAAREAAREAVAATAIPKPNAPDILAEADRFEKLSPSERALETATRKFKDNPYYAKELLSKKERDKRSEDQAKIMNEMLDKREKLSTDRQVDAFLVGWLKPFGTPASGVEEISKEQLKRYKVVDKVKDTQAVKQAAELMQNLKDSYPENVYLKIMEKYQNLIKSGLTREKLIASIKKLNREASGLISREKSATLASKKMPDNFAESELDASDSIVDQTFTNPAMRKLVKDKLEDPLFGDKDITDSEIKSRMWAKITTGAATSPRQALSEVLKEIFAPKK
jgi:hypothetical protein